MDIVAFGKQAKARREELGLSQQDVAQQAGLSRKWYGDIERGLVKSVTSETLTAISRVLDLSGFELPDEERPNFVYIPLTVVRGSAGPGEEFFEEVIERYMAFDRVQLRSRIGVKPDLLVLITVSGHSMYPTLNPGDQVWVEKYHGEPVIDGTIYVFHRQYQGVIIKRAYWRKDGAMLLRSDNREDPVDFVIEPGEEHEWKVVGKVVRVEKSL